MGLAYSVFIIAVWFISTTYVVFLLLTLFQKRNELYTDHLELTDTPLVSVIVPAYNEEKDIGKGIESLKELEYPNYEVIVLNDGSTDNTASEARAAINGDNRFTLIDNEDNKGKAGVLNQGIEHSNGTIVATMDADSMVQPKALNKAVPYFYDEKVGSVTVTVEVANREATWLTRLFSVEFMIGLSLLLKICSFHNAIYVTPGPFSMYRKSVMEDIGGFDEENLTEDLEIAYRIHKAGYKIENCLEAKVRTNLPETWTGTYRQRRRWYVGGIQTLTQHRDMMFNRKHGVFSFLVPWNFTLVFLGLGLFASTLYLAAKSWASTISGLRYTGLSALFNNWAFEFDVFRYAFTDIIGASALLLSFIILATGLYYARKPVKNELGGILLYPMMYVLYQVFWFFAICNVLFKKEVAWR